MSTVRYIQLDQDAVDTFDAFKTDNPEMMPMDGSDCIPIYYQTGSYYVVAEAMLNAATSLPH